MLTPDGDEEKDVAATEFSVTTEDDEATDPDGVDSAEYDQGTDRDVMEFQQWQQQKY